MASACLSATNPSTGLLPIMPPSTHGEAPLWSSHDRCAMIQPDTPAPDQVKFPAPTTQTNVACPTANSHAQLVPEQAQQ